MSACSGDIDASEQEDIAVAASSLTVLRNGGGGHGGGGHGGGGGGHHGGGGHGDHISPELRNALRRGVSRIADLQADTIGDNAHNGLTDTDPDDGGWDYKLPAAAVAHTPNISGSNLFGATALGPWSAIRAGVSGNRSLTVLLDAGVGMQNEPDVDSAPDFVFGVLLAEMADNDGFAELARLRYDAKRAAAGGATGLGNLIRDARHAANNDGLIAYDLGWMTLGAAALDAAFPGAGYGDDADTYAKIVFEDLVAPTPRFDMNDTHERYYITGLAWSLVITSWLGVDDTFREVRTLLLDQQRNDGAWGWNADQPAPDLQTTAHALQTLALSGCINGRAKKASRRAAKWLIGKQATSGGWPDATNIELPLVDAEIVLGLVLSQTEVGRDDGLSPLAGFQGATSGAIRTAAPLD